MTTSYYEPTIGFIIKSYSTKVTMGATRRCFVPRLELLLTFRILTENEINSFQEDHANNPSKEDYKLAVVSHFIIDLSSHSEAIKESVPSHKIEELVNTLYISCVMLNPEVDYHTWHYIATNYAEGQVDSPVTKEIGPIEEMEGSQRSKPTKKKTKPVDPLTAKKVKLFNKHMKNKVIGQEYAIDALQEALVRSQVGLKEEYSPIGVFLFAGASGIGKTYLAKEMHNFLFGDENGIVRVDCGEYQRPHENQKILGSPPGYVGSHKPTAFSQAMRKDPNRVILFDEAEKANYRFWDTFLRAFDEGTLTDSQGNEIDLTKSIVIMTTNIGNAEIARGLSGKSAGFGASLTDDLGATKTPTHDEMDRITNGAIKKYFKPEFINRLDEIIIFDYLNDDSLHSIAELEMEKISKKLVDKEISLFWTEECITKLIEEGTNTIKGARQIEHVRRQSIEKALATTLLELDDSEEDIQLTIDHDGEAFTVER